MAKDTPVDKTEVEAEQSQRGTPYDYFNKVEHELTNRDASFHLLQPGKTLREIMAKAVYPDMDYLVRVSQCIAKLNEFEIGENTLGKDGDPNYSSGIELVMDILNGLPAIEGFNRAEFIQGLGRPFAPSVYELKKTGKIAGSKEAKKRYNILKSKEAKEQEDSPQ